VGKISWTDLARIEVLLGIKEERNILHAIKKERLTGLDIYCV
jgi:hypothetical protein